MTHTYEITGMHCQNCIAKIRNELLKIGDINEAKIGLQPPQATITMLKHVPVSILSQAVSKAGAYSIAETPVQHNEEILAEKESRSWIKAYKPLLLVFGFIFLVSFISSFQDGDWIPMSWMNKFMAGFFIAFSFFKILDLKGFADSYSSYDLLARKWYAYGFFYPFIELALGVSFLTEWSLFYTNLATAIVMGFSLVGVIAAVSKKQKIQCACLGTVFHLPMSKITIVEDLLMVSMALVSVFWFN